MARTIPKRAPFHDDRTRGGRSQASRAPATLSVVATNAHRGHPGGKWTPRCWRRSTAPRPPTRRCSTDRRSPRRPFRWSAGRWTASSDRRWGEADRGVDLELHGREELLQLAGDVGVLEEISHLLGDDAEETVLGLVDLLQEVVRHVLGELPVAHHLLQAVWGLARLLGTELHGPPDDLRDHALQPTPEALAAFVAAAAGRCARACSYARRADRARPAARARVRAVFDPPSAGRAPLDGGGRSDRSSCWSTPP